MDGVVSGWYRYEKGIFAGCTLSVILFLAAFNVIIEYVKMGSYAGYTLSNKKEIEVVRGFMDDVSILGRSVPEIKHALLRTNQVLKWSRMMLKPTKSRSLVMQKGRVMLVEPFVVDGQVIPCIQKEPLKTLGRYFDFTITDRKARDDLKDKLLAGIKYINRSLLTSFMKLWVLHHLLVPQIQWQLMVYEMSTAWVTKLEVTMNKVIRKWLGVSKSLSDVALYCTEVPCPLPFKSLSSIFKTAKSNVFLQLKDSRDTQVRENASAVDVKMKEPISKLIGRAESRISIKEIIGDGQIGRGGLGLVQKRSTPQHGTKEYRKEVISMIKKEEDEKLFIKAVQQGVQGRWTVWKEFVKRDLSWKSL